MIRKVTGIRPNCQKSSFIYFAITFIGNAAKLAAAQMQSRILCIGAEGGIFPASFLGQCRPYRKFTFSVPKSRSFYNGSALRFEGYGKRNIKQRIGIRIIGNKP